MAGIVVAVGVTAIVEMTDNRINSEDDLLSVTPLPILSAIPVLSTAGAHPKQSWHYRLQIATALLLMATIPAITLVTYYQG